MNFTDSFKRYNFPLLGYIKIPRFPIPKDDIIRLNLNEKSTSEDYLCALSREGFDKKLKSGWIPKCDVQIYHDRLDREIKEISRLQFIDYILLIYHIVQFCKKEKIISRLELSAPILGVRVKGLKLIDCPGLKENDFLTSSAKSQVQQSAIIFCFFFR